MIDGAARAFSIASTLPAHGWQPVVIAPPDLCPPLEAKGGERGQVIRRTAGAVDAAGLEHDALASFLRGGKMPGRSVAARVLPRLFSQPHPLSTWKKEAGRLADELIQAEGGIEGIYVQGPPAAPVKLALDLSKKHSLPVLFDLTAPLDPPLNPSAASGMKPADLQGLEERVLTSGFPVITPTRALKEHFLKKHIGRAAHNDISIIPDIVLSLPSGSSARGVAFRPVIFLDTIEPDAMRFFFSSLAAFLQGPLADGRLASIVVVTPEMDLAAKLVGKFRIKEAVELRSSATAAEEAELALGADVVGVVCGSAEHCRLRVPEVLVTAVGLRKPVFVLGTDGAAKQFALESNGMDLSGGGESAPRELLQACYERWREGTLSASNTAMPARCQPERVFGDLARIIAFMLPV